MKALQIFGFVLFMSAMSFSCNGQQPQSKSETVVEKSNKVKVYYFHNERRCTTCKAVESESRKAVKELYGEKISFASFNLDREAGEQKGKEIGVNVQSLMVVCGKKKIDLTNDGFIYARSNP